MFLYAPLKARVELLEIFGDENTVLANKFTIEVQLTAAVIRTLD